MVKVLSKPRCVQCEATINHLKRLGIEHTKIDMTQDPEALQWALEQGYKSAPVVIAGEENWSGYRPDRLTPSHPNQTPGWHCPWPRRSEARGSVVGRDGPPWFADCRARVCLPHKLIEIEVTDLHSSVRQVIEHLGARN